VPKVSTHSEVVVSELERNGISDCFLVTGGAIAPFTDALVRSGKIRMHYMLTEQSAAIAAESYGHFDGRPALLVVTSGPGVTNSLTGVAAAWTNSSPIIVVSGQARSIDVLRAAGCNSRQIGNQHLNTRELCSSIVKQFEEPTDDFDGSSMVKMLYRAAMSNRRGPVWLSFPQDIQRKPALSDFPKTEFSDLAFSAAEAIDAGLFILDELQKAKKPLLFLGNGCRFSDSQSAFISIAEKYDAAVVTTWTGMDLFPTDHNLFSGRPGTIASSWEANLVQQNADLVVVLGARLDLAQIGFQPHNFAPKSKIIRVDIDREEFQRIEDNPRVVNLELDAVAVVASILGSLPDENASKKSWREEIDSYRSLPSAGAYRDTKSGLSTYHVVDELTKISPTDVVLGSSGTCVEMVLQSWKVSRNQRFLNSGGLGSMGFALAAGFGVACKTENSKVLVIESDGSFAMNIQDLQTIAAKSTPVIKIVVLNSQGYKSISISQGKQGQVIHGASAQTGLHLPEISRWAKAAQINHQRIDNELDLRPAILSMWNSEQHEILEIIVSGEEEALPRLMSKPNSTGQMVTTDFSELSPDLEK
jgi:acetolactate synthase-1/2/3 large subunit